MSNGYYIVEAIIRVCKYKKKFVYNMLFLYFEYSLSLSVYMYNYNKNND